MTFEEHGIYINDTSGQCKTFCPKCSKTRKKSSDPCLSVNIDEGVWNCHHCGWKGTLKKVKNLTKVEIVSKPIPPTTEIPDNVYQWFEDRNISRVVVDSEKIGYSDRWIHFPFYKDGEVVNIKSRTGDKKFKQTKNAEKCFYRFDSMVGMETIIITEGEMDALSLVQSGFTNVVSVPDGAPAQGTNPSDKKFSYLMSAEEHLMNANTVILCTDSDGAGKHLREELSRRIGREKCFRVVYPDGCKDMNDVLMQYGEDKVQEVVSEAHPYPIDGVVMVQDVEDDAIDLLLKPEVKGLSTGWSCVDPHYLVSPSEVTVVTGVPNMGKSEWMDAVMINMVQSYGWKFGVFSAENFPVKHHLLKLVGKFTGQPFWGDDKMDEGTARASMKILNEHIKFIGTQEDSVTVESIMEQAKILNFRFGLNGLIIDPWNTLEHKFGDGENETLYVSRVLAQLSAFAKLNELHIWVVAHPRKMENGVDRKPVVPTPYDISGSANWFNKCDNAITVHRHRNSEEDYAGIHVHKIRFQYKNGKPNQNDPVKLKYDIARGKYYEYIEEPKENLFG
ncbi:MAG: putative ATP-dependent helicase [Prokaryotic dsDNA virus sp.]|nr:MAG: putative ATP-dependent helicase [Prokaryotic dsDNA virus sp.]|tara:strand:- start:618 stop:2297 length:1680 start_codon:yes stop_codon:yes gene_type:complete